MTRLIPVSVGRHPIFHSLRAYLARLGKYWQWGSFASLPSSLRINIDAAKQLQLNENGFTITKTVSPYSCPSGEHPLCRRRHKRTTISSSAWALVLGVSRFIIGTNQILEHLTNKENHINFNSPRTSRNGVGSASPSPKLSSCPSICCRSMSSPCNQSRRALSSE